MNELGGLEPWDGKDPVWTVETGPLILAEELQAGESWERR